MNRHDAEKILTEYLKPVFGFALKRCRSIEDAQDLSQEIAVKAFRALLLRDDIEDMGKFIWTVAHNVLNNYYRDSAKNIVGVPIDDIAEIIADPRSAFESDCDAEIIRRLGTVIAYLSKLQRRIIIAYYFENRRQANIAAELDIPVGTVKWHLFEAKKELKRGMDTMRKTSDLKFNPIKFCAIGINGSSGTKSTDDFFRSPLPQNICYCVRDTAKTVNEISDDLGVSPVFVESEVEYLEKYGLLKQHKDKFIANFIIEEPTSELLVMKDKMYKRAAGLFANELYDELMSSGILDDNGIVCGQTDGEITLGKQPKADKNFILWSLIPFIAAWSGEELMDKSISFDEVATIRPDGGHNIYHASVETEKWVLPDDYVNMDNWCGPMWNSSGKNIFWQINSNWSSRENYNFQHFKDACRVIAMYQSDCKLSKDEYAWLAEQGYIKTNGDYDGNFKAAWQIVILKDEEIQKRLLDIGERIKRKHAAEFEALKAPYAKAILDSIPQHLRRIKEYELQYVFYSDGWFLIHCITALLKIGKLKLPTEGQRKALMTVMARN